MLCDRAGRKSRSTLSFLFPEANLDKACSVQAFPPSSCRPLLADEVIDLTGKLGEVLAEFTRPLRIAAFACGAKIIAVRMVALAMHAEHAAQIAHLASIVFPDPGHQIVCHVLT